MLNLMFRSPAARLRVLMAERDVNVQELADMTGLHPTTITALRTGRTHYPNPETAHLIAQALGVKTSNIWSNR